MSTHSLPLNRTHRDLHFDLGWLGPTHETEVYTLRIGGRPHRLARHTPETLAACSVAGSPTHYATQVAVQTDTPQLLSVTVPPKDPHGFPTLASICIHTANDAGSYSVDDVAKAVVFMNPSLTMLTTATAQTVLGHIGSNNIQPLSFTISALGVKWCQTMGVVDDAGKPVLKPNGTQFYAYELDQSVLNESATPSQQSKALIYSDASLQGTRWKLLPGVSVLDMNAQNDAAAVRRAAKATGPADMRMPGSRDGYHVAVQDGGPNYGLSVTVKPLGGDNGNFVIDLVVTNSYIRHTSVFVSFLKADGVTAIPVTNDAWLKQVFGLCSPLINDCLNWLVNNGLENSGLLGTDTLKFLGKVGAESTFLGIPVKSANVDFTFKLPNDGPVGKIRVLVGSLGVSSGNDCDPIAAWFGLSLTALMDLAIPTFALLLTAGVQTNVVFDKMFRDVNLLLPIADNVYASVKDLFSDPSKVGKDISSLVLTLSNTLVKNVLTKPDILASLAEYFGMEEAEEAIPFVGWGFKVLAMEAAAAQLAQTVGEVVGSPRVVEFDLTLTMDAQITLVPEQAFPDTASSFTITAQYTGNTTRTYAGTMPREKVPSLVVDWKDVPVGGKVSFVVAMFDSNGWGVGKGQAGPFDNLLDGRTIFTAQVTVKQELYPLTADTTYQHKQLLQYNGGYQWAPGTQAPTQTAANLGTGPDGGLEGLGNITLSDDLGVLGYVWEASGQGMPPPLGGGGGTPELYTMNNIGYRPIPGGDHWPDAGYMTAPEGYSGAPILLYVRTAPGAGTGAPRFLYLDPSGDKDTGYHLREVTPATDPTVPMGDPRRLFDLATGTSWGRFAVLPTSMAIHSNGYVVAVNPSCDHMLILALSAMSSPDADAPWASAPLQSGTAPGRFLTPALVAIRPDQTILVLEAGNQRIQAFSRGGHPVPAFPSMKPPYWFPLVSHARRDNVVYLSMSVDVANYVFILSQIGNGYDATDFYLDVYAPTGTLLFSQRGLNAAGLAVDLWRNVYTLNYQQIAGPGGRPEPSISEYTPSTPKVEQRSSQRDVVTDFPQVAMWRLSIGGVGYTLHLDAIDGELLIAGFDAPADEWGIFDLGGGNIALGTTVSDQNGKLIWVYWNSHHLTQGGTNNGGMELLNNDTGYSSSSIGPEQTFKLINMGAGRLALQITAGPNAGQYLAGQQGGYYPVNGGPGTGSFMAIQSNGPPSSFGLDEGSDQLPILKITGGSGYFLQLAGKDLTGCILTDMRHCTLDGATLSGITTLVGADFTNASLRKAILSGLDLGQASTWNEADFTGTDLSTVKSAAGAHMEGAILNGATLGSVSYAGAHLAAAKFNTADGRNTNLNGTIFTRADLTGADLTGALLVGADFRGAILHGTIFDGCDLTQAVFDDQPDFTRATTGRTTFHTAVVPFAILGKNWSYLDLIGATITGIPHAVPKLVADQALLPDNFDLQNTDFSCSDGAGASFRGTRMYGVQLQGANLQAAQMQGALLKSAKLDGANLTLADLTAAWLIVETATPTTPKSELEAASLIKAFMFNTVLNQAHCDGVDFTDAVFSTSSALNAQQPASAEGAFMNDAKFNDAQVLGAIFNGAQLAGANFANARLIGSTFKNSGSVPTQLTPSSRDGSDASIALADISGTDFTGADMGGLDMVGATVATKGNFFGKKFKGYHNATVLVSFNYGPTVFGNTTKNTTCPDGNPGPCKVA